MSSQAKYEDPPVKRQRSEEGDLGEDYPEEKEQTIATTRELSEQEQEEDDADEEFRLLEAVSAVQDDLNALEEEEAKEVLVVHKAFLKRKRPLYTKRQEAISKVPEFWLKVLLGHPGTQRWVADVDQPALGCLEAVSVHKALSRAVAAANQEEDAEDVGGGAGDGHRGKGKKTAEGSAKDMEEDDGLGFRVTFTFRENPFFSNAQLWKEWEPGETNHSFYSPINWKDTEDSRELQAHLLDADDPAFDDEVDAERPSFFSIFSADMNDLELGEALRGDIIQNPLEIYMRHDYVHDEDDEDDENEDGPGEEMEDLEEEGDDALEGEEVEDFEEYAGQEGEEAQEGGQGGVDYDEGEEGGEEKQGAEEGGFPMRGAGAGPGKGKRKRDLVEPGRRGRGGPGGQPSFASDGF